VMRSWERSFWRLRESATAVEIIKSRSWVI
jgi:hypothetical protein